MFRNFYWAWDARLSSDFCDYVVNKADWSKADIAKLSPTSDVVNDKQRITEVVWEEVHSPIACVAFQHIMMANEMAGWNFNIKVPELVQLGKYKEGGHYDWHVDSFEPDDFGNQRKLSCSILLNDPSEYEGGVLELKEVGKPPPTSKGTIIVFPSILEHRVTPVTSGVRYSAVCWAIGEAFK